VYGVGPVAFRAWGPGEDFEGSLCLKHRSCGAPLFFFLWEGGGYRACKPKLKQVAHSKCMQWARFSPVPVNLFLCLIPSRSTVLPRSWDPSIIHCDPAYKGTATMFHAHMIDSKSKRVISHVHCHTVASDLWYFHPSHPMCRYLL